MDELIEVVSKLDAEIDELFDQLCARPEGACNQDLIDRLDMLNHERVCRSEAIITLLKRVHETNSGSL